MAKNWCKIDLIVSPFITGCFWRGGAHWVKHPLHRNCSTLMLCVKDNYLLCVKFRFICINFYEPRPFQTEKRHPQPFENGRIQGYQVPRIQFAQERRAILYYFQHQHWGMDKEYLLSFSLHPWRTNMSGFKLPVWRVKQIDSLASPNYSWSVININILNIMNIHDIIVIIVHLS